MIYHIKYKFYWMIENFGIYLDKFPRLGLLSYHIEDWASRRIDLLIECKYGPQTSWGWEGSELEGLSMDEVEEYTLRKKHQLGISNKSNRKK